MEDVRELLDMIENSVRVARESLDDEHEARFREQVTFLVNFSDRLDYVVRNW
jgi:hypothetical protein